MLEKKYSTSNVIISHVLDKLSKEASLMAKFFPFSSSLTRKDIRGKCFKCSIMQKKNNVFPFLLFFAFLSYDGKDECKISRFFHKEILLKEHITHNIFAL